MSFWDALVIPLSQIFLIDIDKCTYTSVHIGGLIWGITVPLIICLVTIARQQTIVSLVATLYVNGLYTLGPVPPRVDLRLLLRPSPSPSAPLRKIQEMLLCTVGGNRECGWDGAGPDLCKHFLVLPLCDQWKK